MTGNCYAIPSKDYRIQTMEISDIAYYVDQFINIARYELMNKELYTISIPVYLVTEIGCGLAGYEPKDIAPLFIKVKELGLENVYLPKRFIEVLENGSKKEKKSNKSRRNS